MPASAGSRNAVLFARARALIDQEKYQEARLDLEEILSANSDHILAHNLLGFVLYKEGDYDGSVSNFFYVVEREPSNEDAQFRLVASLKKAERYEEALNHLDGLSQANLEFGWVEREQAVVLFQLEKSAEALEFYLRAVEHRPNDRQAFHGVLQACREELSNGQGCPEMKLPGSVQISCEDAEAQFRKLHPEIFWHSQTTLFVGYTSQFVGYRMTFDDLVEKDDFRALALLPTLIRCSEENYRTYENFDQHVVDVFYRVFPREILGYYEAFSLNLALSTPN